MAWTEINNETPYPEMLCVLVYCDWYSHGRIRHAYFSTGYSQDEGWRGVNANGTCAPLGFEPTHWMGLPDEPGK